MAVVHSSVLVGVEIAPVRVEAVCSPGFSGLHLLGLPGEAAREARERVRVALEACGVRCEEARITVQLHAEAPLRSARSPLALLDFAIAAAVLLALRESDDGAFAARERPPLHCAGSLTLVGALEARDAFPYLEAVAQEVSSEWVACVPSPRGAFRAADDSPLRRARTFAGLRAFEAWMNDGFPAPLTGSWPSSRSGGHEPEDDGGDALAEWNASFEARFFESLRGWARHPPLALALTLALAGRLNVMLMGSPGVGKTHALRAYAPLLPPLSAWERAERRLIAAASDGDPREAARRPFRSPHHACSVAGLVGNASLAPGEFTLAHRGVLFLDEFLEFARTRTEALREPLECGRVSLSRARGQVALPAEFQLLAATNPCRCGLFFSARRACRCAPRERLKALESLSGPLLDRFHLRFLVEGSAALGMVGSETPAFASLPSRGPGHGRTKGAPFDAPPALLVERILQACEGGSSFEALARNVKEAALEAHRTKGSGDACEPFPPDPADPLFAPDTGGPFPNVRSRVHAERLLRTAAAVFPEEAALAGTAGLLASLLPLRSLDATLDHVLLYDAPLHRAPSPAPSGALRQHVTDARPPEEGEF